jgi:hypothetical protein
MADELTSLSQPRDRGLLPEDVFVAAKRAIVEPLTGG